jgi:hypothetical protein
MQEMYAHVCEELNPFLLHHILLVMYYEQTMCESNVVFLFIRITWIPSNSMRMKPIHSNEWRQRKKRNQIRDAMTDDMYTQSLNHLITQPLNHFFLVIEKIKMMAMVEQTTSIRRM